jgi:Phage related hypothetical protein (DUF1799)
LGVFERRALKKLEAAARRWAGADAPPAQVVQLDANVVAGMRVMGVSEADIAAAQAQQAARVQAAGGGDFEVHADNWEVWQLFATRLATQWIWVAVGGTSRRWGLCNTRVESTLRMLGIPRRRQAALLADLQVMEQASLQAWAERDEAGG